MIFVASEPPNTDRHSPEKLHYTEPVLLCSRCGLELPRSAFGDRLSKGKVIRQTYCKPCHVDYHRQWRRTERGHERHTTAVNAYRARHPVRQKARIIAAKAVKSGRLRVEPCEIGVDCDGPMESHHDDYSKPLEVRWFCRRHHRAEDAHKVGRPRKVGP